MSVAGHVAWAAQGVAQAFDVAGPLAVTEAMTVDTRTDVGSVTKVMATTAALMVHVSRGTVRLGDRLAEVLPWTATAPAGSATIEQLLGHRAGLWEWWPLYLSSGTVDAALHRAVALPLRYPVGRARHYSDLGFQLLGQVVAQLSGTDLASAVAELVLGPCGLAATRFGRPAPGGAVAASSTGDGIERRMIHTGRPYPVDADELGFDRWRQDVLVGEVNDGNAYHAFSSVAGHAGLFSTARDLLRFGEALRRGLGGSVDAGTVERFLSEGPDPGQGLGWRCWRIDADGPAWGHTGFPGVALATVPHLGASVALVTNRLHVRGEPRPTGAMWDVAFRGAREYLGAEASSSEQKEGPARWI